MGRDIREICREIRSSEWVIADMVGDDQEKYWLHNAEILFLVGLAMGLGKKLMVFKEKPVQKSMLDLYRLIVEYEDVDDILSEIRKM